MNTIRHQMERGFEKFALLISRRPLVALAIMVVFIVSLVSQLPKLTVDTSTEGFLHDTDPALLTYNAFKDQFGRDEVIVVALKPKAVFDFAFLKTLKRLHEELASEVPYLDDITSLINARNTRGQKDELIVEDLLENWPVDQAELQAIKNRALSNPIYRNLLISEDGSFTTLVIKTVAEANSANMGNVLEGFDDMGEETAPAPVTSAPKAYLTDAQNTEVVMAVKKIVGRYESETLPIYLAGSPVVTHFLKQSMMGDMRKFMLIAFATVAVILFIMFRRLSGVVLPLLIVLLSLLSTLGIMAATGTAIKVPTQILPSFILAVGVGTAVHILAIFFQQLQNQEDRARSIAFALGHSGLAVVMTNLTTASGLLSFAAADVAPVADIGIFAAIGVILAFVYTIVLLPALLSLLPIGKLRSQTAHRNMHRMDAFLARVSRFATSHPKKILAVTALLLCLSAIGSTRIMFSHHVLEWFPQTNEIRTDTETIDRNLRGSISMEVVLDTGRKNGLYDHDFLDHLDKAAVETETWRQDNVFVGKAWSLPTILKEINQALNENRPEAYTIPKGRDLIAQELLLFENSGSDDLEDFVDSQFSKVRFTLKFPFVDAVAYKPFLTDIDAYFQSRFPGTQFKLTGMITLLATVINNTITTMAKSYVTAFTIITVLMVILIGRVRIGLLSMIPNLVPIVCTMGVIGAFGLPMDLFTMMVASIAIGLAVDDTIHFMHNFRRYYELSGDPVEAVAQTLHTTGRAMLVTSVVLSAGFFIYMLATMQNIVRFGFLTGLTIILALLSDYLIAPALMVVVNKKREIAETSKR